jgi:nucleoside phosphorylase/DNA-binding transcriptional ArsR family regulator/tetratricopeptide (TPR) repeat protein
VPWHPTWVRSVDHGLNDRAGRVLDALLGSTSPVSGRRVAAAVGVSPTTASAYLKELREAGLARAHQAGRAMLWSANLEDPRVAAIRNDVRKGPVQHDRSVDPVDSVVWPVARLGARPVVPVVVLTALALEYQAMRKHLADPTLLRTPSGTRYEVGILPGDKVDWRVHIAEIGMGNAGAAVEVTGAIDIFGPRLLLFVGVAGGLKAADQSKGDVVVANLVYNVHSAKLAVGAQGESQVLSRPLSFPAPHRLTQLARAVSRTEWLPGQLLQTMLTVGTRSPEVHLRPIVAAEVVLADPSSDLRERIAEQFNDAVAIDMESFGVYEAAHRYELPVLAVRGLSDLVGDKDATGDRDWQPRAAQHAAAFAVALLRAADENDLPARTPPSPGDGPPLNTRPQGDRSEPGQPAETSLARLAPTLRPFWRRLRDSIGLEADRIVAELADTSGSVAAWLGRIRHRPPIWLREDTTGDAWALVARFAESHNSAHASWAFDEAARRASGHGEPLLAALHRIRMALNVVREAHDGLVSEAPEEAVPRAIAVLDGIQEPAMAPLIDFARAGARGDAKGILDAAPAAVVVLDMTLETDLFAREVMQAVRQQQSMLPADVADLESTDGDLVNELRSEVLIHISNALLFQSNVRTALRLLEKAREINPAAAGPIILLAKARLEQATGPGAAFDPEIDVSTVLAEVENLALVARDRRRDWNGESAEALAVAARARAQAGDPSGALRLLLPPPRGVATNAEAQHPNVREIAAMTAIMSGDPTLALDLATGIGPPVERDLVRGMALSRLPNASDRAEQVYRAALNGRPPIRADQLVRALLGLARLGVSISSDNPQGVGSDFGRLRELDPEAADLVEATAALAGGRAGDALVLTRQYPTSIAAIELAAEAAVANGDHDEAIRVLEKAGRSRRDDGLLVQAMLVALEAGRDDTATQVAGRLVLSPDPTTRRQALQVMLDLAARAADWERVADLSRRLLQEEDLEVADSQRSASIARYRWALAHAEFNLRQVDRARRAIDGPTPLQPTTRADAMLLIAILHATVRQAAANQVPLAEGSSSIIERVLDAAAAFSDDEDVVAFALTLLMTISVPDPLPDVLLSRIRTLQEVFFNRFPDTTLLRRIDVGDDLSGITEHLRSTLAVDTEQLTDLARQVWLGIYPQALLADAVGRPYAEALIKRAVGCSIATTVEPRVIELERASAHQALDSGRIVIDTSAVVMLDHLGAPPERILAEFSEVMLTAPCRDDILLARDALALRSSASIGWDAAQQRPSFTEFSAEMVDEWATVSARVATRLSRFEVLPGDGGPWSWDSSLKAAQREKVSLWVDDLAFRHAARSVGVAAFGTLDLIAALSDRGRLQSSFYEMALEDLREAYVVDLPVSARLIEFARAHNWEPEGYALLLLARPAFWIPANEGFGRLTAFIRTMPDEIRKAEGIAQWVGAAMTGLAWATPPAARPAVLASLLAWSALAVADPKIFPLLLDAGENILSAAAPDGDLLAATVQSLTETLSSIVQPHQVGDILVGMFGSLDKPRHDRAMRIFLTGVRN